MENNNNTQQLDALLASAKTESDVAALLKDKDRLLRKKPFTRGGSIKPATGMSSRNGVKLGSKVSARLSTMRRYPISQDQYVKELDPSMHDVLFDENIPSICVKTVENGAMEIKFVKSAFPMQQCIMEKQTLHMACMPMKFTLADKKPTDTMQQDFVTFKHYWDLRNQDGMKVKMVAAAKSFGDAGLLYYLDRHGEIKSRLIRYEDGYVICSHNDANGDRILEAVYYLDSDGNECIDCWDDRNFYRFTTDIAGNYEMVVEPHPFGEIPLITKRTQVAWDRGQTLIEGYERTANIFQVLQNKWGWGLLYVKGQIDPNAKKIAGNIVMNDISIDTSKSDAKFLDPPKPQNGIDTLDLMFKQIEIACGTTFILPSDIHTSSDTSGVAVQMTQSLDIQTAKNGIVEWQNVADKMVRLFKRGLAIELVNKGIKEDAITEFDKLNINAQFEIWQPYSQESYNQMLATMKNAGILSQLTATEQNTISRPDEWERLKKEEAETIEKELEKTRRTKELEAQYSTTSQNPQGGSKQGE